MWIVIRGGGDLASGVAMRLYRSGLRVIVTELPQPLVVRRRVAFAEAVYDGQIQIEGVMGRRVPGADRGSLDHDLMEQGLLDRAEETAQHAEIPVLVDPDGQVIDLLRQAQSGHLVVVDARMLKRPPEPFDLRGTFVIGLGPGFTAGLNCHAVVETNRGHALGRVIWQGQGEPDTGIPERVRGYSTERVLRSPASGRLLALAEIGDHLQAGQAVAQVDGQAIQTPITGTLRGLIRSGLPVSKGLKIGDVDPRSDPRYCYLVSDKSLAIGGGVLEALLSQASLRPYLWV